MGLSVRVFGLSSWSMLVPQALVRRRGGRPAVRRPCGAWPARPPGSSPARVLALTPVAALMFRFDNPDALLVLLLVGAAYALTRALENAATRWLAARRRARRRSRS